MGLSYFIVLDNEKPGFETFVNGKYIAQAYKKLGGITKDLKMKSIDEFCGNEEAAEILGIEDELEGMETQWFEAEEGLAWVAKLREHLEANRASIKEAKNVLSDLKEYEELLKKAKKIGAKWRLGVDF
jgi:hypothetical protein